MLYISCLLIDGNEADSLALQTLLSQVPVFTRVDHASTGSEALCLLASSHYDLVFLDMNLPDMPGLDWLCMTPQRPPVIALSTIAEQAVPCYDLNVADFLLKPLERARLLRAINRGLTINLTERSQTYRQGIFLHTARRLQQFLFDDIQYVEAHGAYSKICTDTETTTVSDSISWIESQLPPSQFVRIQKSFMVNMKRVTAVEARNVWIGKTKLSIGQQYREHLRQLVS